MIMYHFKNINAGFQVPERRFGNPRFIKLISPRQTNTIAMDKALEKYSMIQASMISQTLLSQGFRDAGQEYTQTISSWIWYFFESCTTNIDRPS